MRDQRSQCKRLQEQPSMPVQQGSMLAVPERNRSTQLYQERRFWALSNALRQPWIC